MNIIQHKQKLYLNKFYFIIYVILIKILIKFNNN